MTALSSKAGIRRFAHAAFTLVLVLVIGVAIAVLPDIFMVRWLVLFAFLLGCFLSVWSQYYSVSTTGDWWGLLAIAGGVIALLTLLFLWNHLLALVITIGIWLPWFSFQRIGKGRRSG